MTERKTSLLLAGLLLVAVTAAYWPALGSGLLAWDDPDILGDELPESLGDIWGGKVFMTYLPVTFTSLWLDREISAGGDGTLYHVVNLLLHFLNAVLVWRLARRILERPEFAWGAAFLFALHPLATESVAWIAERKGLLAFTFSALSMLAFLEASERRGGRRIGHHALGTALLVLALLSKGSALVVPLILLAYVIALRWGERRGRWWIDLAPYLVAAAILAWIHYGIARDAGPALAPGEGGVGKLLVTGIAVLARYLRLLFLPVAGQSLVPDVQLAEGALLLSTLIGVVLLAAVVAALAVLWRRDRRMFLGLLIATVALAPYNNILPRTTALFAERYLYVSILGAALLAAAGLGRLKKGGGFAIVGLCVLLLILTRLRTSLWDDGVEVFRDAKEKSPDSWLAASKLADALKMNSRYEEAEVALGDAIRNAGRPAEELRARVDRAGVLLLLSRGKEALATLEPGQALLAGLGPEERRTSGCDMYLNRGTAQIMLGDEEAAVESYRAAGRADPGRVQAFSVLCTALARSGDLQGALQAGEEAVRLDRRGRRGAPPDEDAALNLAEARLLAGQTREALSEITLFLGDRPGSVRARLLMGRLSVAFQRPREAAGHFRAALEASPGHRAALSGLSRTDLMLARAAQLEADWPRAAEHAEQAVRRDPQNGEALLTLAELTPDRVKAEDLLRRAAALPGGDRAGIKLAALLVTDALRLAAADAEGAAARVRDALGVRPSRLELNSRIRISGLLPRVIEAAKEKGRGADLFLIGIAKHVAGRHEAAVEDLTRAVDAAPPDEIATLAAFFAGRAELADGKLAEATKRFEKLAGRPGAGPWPNIFLAGCLARAGARETDGVKAADLWARARSTARTAVALAPDLVETRLRLGEIEMASERYDEALKAFLQARREHPGRVEPLLDLAQLYKLQFHLGGEKKEHKHYLEQARDELSAALAIDPRDARALAARGEVLVRLGLPGGEIDLRLAILEDPELMDARVVLAAVHLIQARRLLDRGGPEAEAAALRLARKAVALGTKTTEPHLFLAEFERKRKDFPSAENHILAAIAIDPDAGAVLEARAAFHKDRGYAFLLAGARERGLLEFRKAVAVGAEGFDLRREREMLGLDPPADGPPGPEVPEDSEMARLLRKQTEAAERCFEEASRLLAEGELKAAEEQIRASLAFRSTADGQYLLGLVLEGREMKEQAEKAYAVAVRRKPALAGAWLRLGNLRYFRGDLAGSIVAYEGFLIHAGDEAPEDTAGEVRARIREMRGKLDENR